MTPNNRVPLALRASLEVLHLLRGVILLGGIFLAVHYEEVWHPWLGLSLDADDDHLLAFMLGGTLSLLVAMPVMVLTEKLSREEAPDASA